MDDSFESLDPSPTRLSRKAFFQNTFEDVVTEHQPKSQKAKASLEDFVQTLQSSGLSGPLVVTRPFLPIGRGGQSAVYKADLHLNSISRLIVAVKLPLFDVGVGQKLIYTHDSTMQHLENLSVEVKALTTPDLQRHRNIVNLMGWSWDPDYNGAPLLILELATSDLAKLLRDQGETLSHQQRYAICSDLAGALDAIHACGFIHGDLKPRNVLMFLQDGCCVAKLADFGLSTGDLMNETLLVPLHGTPGWRAPEVERGEQLTPDGAVKADNYSFGLVMQRLMQSLESTGTPMMLTKEKMDETISSLLSSDPTKRPHKLSGLLNPNGDVLDDQTKQTPDVSSELRSDNSLNSFRWQLLPDWMKGAREAPHGVLFDMFLELTSLEGRPDVNHHLEYSALDILLKAAEQGWAPASAVIPDVFEYYGHKIPDGVEKRLVDHLCHAVATGSTLSRHALVRRNRHALPVALQQFEAAGGYGTSYKTSTEESQLHSVARSGTVADLRAHLDEHPDTDIECLTARGESPLFLACTRGAWPIVAELLDRGADATRSFTSQKITCLHWLFAFNPPLDDIFNPWIHDMIIKRLIKVGSDINARASSPINCFHYPFQLPAGTPLHWAVVTHSYAAASALVMNGADVGIRDGSDPYRYDWRVRLLGEFSHLGDDAYSVSECDTQGLSPMDYAVLDYNISMFEQLRLTHRSQINSVDEEGFTVLHRLSASHVRRTWAGQPFSFLPFVGSPDRQRGCLNQIVEEIRLLGGDIEQLTTPNGRLSQKRSHVEQYTPLMLAALNGCTDVVCALLKAGANANATNPTGITALHCISEYEAAATEICRCLFEAGAIITTRRGEGPTPLLAAAIKRNLDTVEMMLSKGADLEEMGSNGLSALWILAKSTGSGARIDVGYDKALTKLVEEWLLDAGSCDPHKRSRILTYHHNNRGTLLHKFALECMPCTVEALIRGGANVNAIVDNVSYWLEPRMEKVKRRQTPLDAVIFDYETREKSGRKRLPFQNNVEGDYFRVAADAVVAALRRAGGKRLSELEPDSSLVDDSRELQS